MDQITKASQSMSFLPQIVKDNPIFASGIVFGFSILLYNFYLRNSVQNMYKHSASLVPEGTAIKIPTYNNCTMYKVVLIGLIAIFGLGYYKRIIAVTPPPYTF